MTPAAPADSSLPPFAYHFTRPALLEEALTHKSYVYERKSGPRVHNERLEFLGDAVLSLLASEHLARQYPQLSEGALSKLKAALVSEPSLAQAARRLQLGARLRLGRGEERSLGREKNSILADALEAVIAAVYLDGGLDASRDFTLRVLEPEFAQAAASQAAPGGEDYKTRLQEWCQKGGLSLPHYELVQESGPDHLKSFEVAVRVKGEIAGQGRGSTKKEAEQLAAQQALEWVVS